MRLLIINNGTKRIHELKAALRHHHLHTINYDGKLDDIDFEPYDAIILSGSSKNEPQGEWYSAEVNLIRECPKPILAICMGFELVMIAGGHTLKRASRRIEGPKPIDVEPLFWSEFGHHHMVHEKHKWYLEDLAQEFELLFRSDRGIEGVRHRHLPIIATQFHPEVQVEELANSITVERLLNFLSKQAHNEPGLALDAMQAQLQTAIA